MALKVKLEKLEDASESERPFYKKQDDGSFLLDTEGEPEAGALKTTLSKVRREKGDLERKLAAFGELTPEELTDMQDRLAVVDANKDGKGPDVQAAVDKATKPLKNQLDQANLTVAEQQQVIDRFTRVDAARDIFETMGDWHGLEPHVLPHLKSAREEVQGANGKKVVKWVAQVVDPETGEVREGVTIEKLAGEMKASGKYSRLFDGTGASGSGATPSGGSSSRTPVASSSSGGKDSKRSSTYNAL